MIGRRSTIGLALLCAFAFCAFAAQSAMAQVGTKAVNTTAVTCVKGGGNEDFTDSHCDTKVADETGEYGHVAIANDTTTEIDVSLVGTGKINSTLSGVSTEVTCNTIKSVAGKSFIHNVETSGKHTVTGTGQLQISNCTVAKPAKCKVKEPILTTAEAQGVEGLKPGGSDMGIEYIGTGANKNFAELTFENKGAEKCSLLNGGKAFVVKGTAIATGQVAQGNQHSGATLVYEDANEMETLEIGLKKASLAATTKTSMAGGGNPIAVTTVT